MLPTFWLLETILDQRIVSMHLEKYESPTCILISNTAGSETSRNKLETLMCIHFPSTINWWCASARCIVANTYLWSSCNMCRWNPLLLRFLPSYVVTYLLIVSEGVGVYFCAWRPFFFITWAMNTLSCKWYMHIAYFMLDYIILSSIDLSQVSAINCILTE